MKTRLVLLLAGLAAPIVAARAEVEFAGYMRTPQGELKFVLEDGAARQISDWLGLGGNFAGYRVTGFDVKSETLAVEKDGATRRLRLKNAALAATGEDNPFVDTAAAGPPPTPEEVAATREMERLRLSLRSRANLLKGLQERRAYILDRQPAAEALATSPHAAGQARTPDERLALTQAETQQALGYLEEQIAQTNLWIALDWAALDRHHRVVLLETVRRQQHGDPAELARTQAMLREVEARLAKAGTGAVGGKD